jgi:hypothetical protein
VKEKRNESIQFIFDALLELSLFITSVPLLRASQRHGEAN